MKNPKVEVVKLSELVPDKLQPRQEFDPADMKRLEESIASRGILNPLVVEKMPDGKYLIIDGERRYRASTALKLKEVPVIIEEPMSVLDRLISRFHLQEQHAGWSAFDKARAINALQTETKMTTTQIADMLGIASTTVREYLTLASLSKRTMSLAEQGRIPYSYFKELGKITRVVDSVVLRQKLEDALVEKIDKKVILGYKDFRKYRIAIIKGGERIINEIVKNKYLTSKEALDSAKATPELYHASIMQGSRWLVDNLRKGITHKSYEVMISSDYNMLVALMVELKNFTNKCNID